MSERKRRMQVPVGVEKLLYLAARDQDFKRMLLEHRAEAIEASGLTLRSSEAAALQTIDDRALEAMIASIVPTNPRRRKFMGLVAAAATSLAAGTVVISCDGASGDVLGKGATGDTDVDGDTDTEDSDTDTDTVDTETETGWAGGAQPDDDVDGCSNSVVGAKEK